MSIITSLAEQGKTLLTRVFGYPEFRGEQAAIVSHQATGGGTAAA